MKSISAVKESGGFQVIYADPPWTYRDKGCNGSSEHHYRSMTMQEMYRLPVKDIAAEDSVLFLWATYPTLIDALRLMMSWEFQYKTLAFQWVKTTANGGTAFGAGHWTRANTEPCLLGVRGHPKRASASVRQVIMARRGRHSAKPPETRDRIVELMGDVPRVELFARESTPGWDCWGNECESTISMEVPQ
jgi:N6-adenosine-specific RNA methylase IME4